MKGRRLNVDISNYFGWWTRLRFAWRILFGKPVILRFPQPLNVQGFRAIDEVML